jgi:hypothetical protein
MFQWVVTIQQRPRLGSSHDIVDLVGSHGRWKRPRLQTTPRYDHSRIRTGNIGLYLVKFAPASAGLVFARAGVNPAPQCLLSALS